MCAEKGLFLVEGRRELERCLAAGFRARSIFRCPELIGDEDFAESNAKLRAMPIADALKSPNPYTQK